MFRSLNTPKAIIQATIALSLVATVTLVGCGTDMTTAPSFVAIENDDGYQPGELPLPGRRTAVEAPIGLALQSISANGAVITWNAPGEALSALIDLNGVRIAEVDAADGAFTDNLAKSPGMYHYTVCFQNSQKRTGQMKWVEGEVKAVPDGSDRRDDDFEDGR